jgi:O-antigen ligase
MAFFTLAALSVVLGYATFQRAGGIPSDWHYCLIATGIICVLHFLFATRRDVPKLDRITLIALAVFFFIAVLPIVPLPLSLIRILSPARAELLNASAPFTGGLPAYAPLSVAPYNTAEYILTLLAYLAVFLLIRDVAFILRRIPWITVWPLLVIGTFQAILGFYQAYADPARFAHANGTYDSYDHYAGLLEMILPFALIYPAAILQRDRNRHESPAGPALKACSVLVVAALLLIGIIHSLSRMGFLVALAVLFVTGSIALSLRGFRVDYTTQMAMWRRVVPTVLVAVVVVFGFIFLPTDPLIARFSEFAQTEDISADTRAQIWRDTVGLIQAYPLTGSGLGTYESAFYPFKTVAPMNTVDYAHNDYMQVMAEMGLIGFAAGLFFILRTMQRTLRGAVYARSMDQRYLAIGCIASITGILLHSFVDFNMYVPANGYAFAWILGIAGMNLRRRAPSTTEKRASSSTFEPGRKPEPSAQTTTQPTA